MQTCTCVDAIDLIKRLLMRQVLSCFVGHLKLHEKLSKRTGGFTIQGICPRNANKLFESAVISDRSQCCTYKKAAQNVQKKMRMFVIAFNNNTVFFAKFLLFSGFI